MLQSLMQDSQLLTVIETHKGLNGQISDDLLLDDPEYLEAILIYLQSKNTAFPARLQRLLGTKKLPSMDVKWMERLLQGFLYDDTDSYLCDKVYREMLIDQLKSQGLIEKKKSHPDQKCSSRKAADQFPRQSQQHPGYCIFGVRFDGQLPAPFDSDRLYPKRI